MADKPFLMTTTLWDFPSQQYGDEDQGDQDYRGATPSYIIWNLLSRYTKAKDLVVDPMAGSGTTLDVARDLGRRALGYDLNVTRKDIFRSDARHLPLEDGKADFVFIDPPYSTHLKYSGDERCIGELSSEDPAYYEAMAQVISEIDRVLRPGHHMALYVSDSYRKGHPFCAIGFELFNLLRQHFEPVDIVAVVRRNRSLLRNHWHTSAVEGNYFLRGFNYLFIMKKPERPSSRPDQRAEPRHEPQPEPRNEPRPPIKAESRPETPERPRPAPPARHENLARPVRRPENSTRFVVPEDDQDDLDQVEIFPGRPRRIPPRLQHTHAPRKPIEPMPHSMPRPDAPASRPDQETVPQKPGPPSLRPDAPRPDAPAPRPVQGPTPNKFNAPTTRPTPGGQGSPWSKQGLPTTPKPQGQKPYSASQPLGRKPKPPSKDKPRPRIGLLTEPPKPPSERERPLKPGERKKK